MDWDRQSGSAAETYDAFLAPAMFEPCAALVLDAAGVTAGEAVVDVACGTGVLTRAAAARVGPAGRVVGVDLGRAMLDVAARHGGAISYLQGDATALPLPDGGFDVATCQHGLMFVPDRAAAVRELLRVVRPGGRVAIACWGALEQMTPFVPIVAALREHLGEEPAAMLSAPFSVSPGELAGLLGDAGAADVAVVQETWPATYAAHADFADRVIAAGPVAPVHAAAAPAARAAVRAAVAAALAPYADPGGDTVTAPITTTLATARRPD